MRKLLLLFISLTTLASCDIGGDDSEPNFSLEILPIQSVDVPDQFVLGQVHSISVTYVRPSSCYQFNSFIFQNNINTRTVAVVDTLFLGEGCTQIGDSSNSFGSEVVTVSFDFTVTNTDVHIFQFFQGQDAQGQDQYLIVEVSVVQ